MCEGFVSERDTNLRSCDLRLYVRTWFQTTYPQVRDMGLCPRPESDQLHIVAPSR